MRERLAFKAASPEGVGALGHPESYVRRCGLEPSLLELVELRAAQINGWAYRIDMHAQDARAGGETERRRSAPAAWRETPFYIDRERAAPAWTEAVAEVARGHVPDEVYQWAPALRREGAGRPDPGHRRHRRVEPAGDRLSRGARNLSALRRRTPPGRRARVIATLKREGPEWRRSA